MTALRDNFRENVKRILRERGLTQRDLARMLGITDASMSQILSKESTPTLATIEAIAKALSANNFALLVPMSEQVAEENLAAT